MSKLMPLNKDFQKIWIQRPSFQRGLVEEIDVETWRNSSDYKDQSPNLVFIGRSNVGKSSLLNSLFGNKLAKVSNTPGRTQQINVFLGSIENHLREKVPFYLYDLPGHGHAEVSKAVKNRWERLMSYFFETLPEKSLILFLQDSRHPDTPYDQMMHEFIKTITPNFFLVFTKYDKLKTQKERHQFEVSKKEIFKKYKKTKQIHVISNESNLGIEALALALHSSIINFTLQDTLLDKDS